MPILTRSGNQTEQSITFILALAEPAYNRKLNCAIRVALKVTIAGVNLEYHFNI